MHIRHGYPLLQAILDLISIQFCCIRYPFFNLYKSEKMVSKKLSGFTFENCNLQPDPNCDPKRIIRPYQNPHILPLGLHKLNPAAV